MNLKLNTRGKAILLVAAMLMMTVASTRLKADTGTCGGQSITLPFTDVPSSNLFFCAIAEAFFTGLTNGTTATTYSPNDPVPRQQMAAFVTRTLDQAVTRSSKRAALRQFWTTQNENSLGLTTVGSEPRLIESDGADIWVPNQASNSVSRVRASDGKLLDTYTGVTNAFGVVCAMGKVFVTGHGSQGSLCRIDPTVPSPGGVVSFSFGGAIANPLGITFDGHYLWTANQGPPGGVTTATLGSNSSTEFTVTTGFNSCFGILYDGANVWVTDGGDNQLKKLDSVGKILQSVAVGQMPLYPAFDGTNIWVPNLNSNSISVVRAKGSLAGTVIATLTGNGLNGPQQAAFDGERILVTNFFGDSVSLWKASDLTPIGTFSTGTNTEPFGACSDGVNFWVSLFGTGKLARF